MRYNENRRHLYINLRRSSDVFVRSFLGLADGRTDGRTDGRPSDSFSSLWAAFKLTVHIKHYIMKGYMERKNMQVESIRFR